MKPTQRQIDEHESEMEFRRSVLSFIDHEIEEYDRVPSEREISNYIGNVNEKGEDYIISILETYEKPI